MHLIISLIAGFIIVGYIVKIGENSEKNEELQSRLDDLESKYHDPDDRSDDFI